MIRLVENATGRRELLRRARGFEAELTAGGRFFDVMVARYGLSLEVTGGSLRHIPRSGPLVVVANHPYGLLDGLMLGHLLGQVRPDFKIIANSIFDQAPDARRHLLPIRFERTREALACNIATRHAALDHLERGGVIGIFPGGTVSTGARPLSPAMDPHWRTFTARMIVRSGASVLPVYFEGQTSRMFQIASHLHATLRMGLMMQEFRKRLDTPVQVVIGSAVANGTLAPFGRDAKAMMDFLRKATYELAPERPKCFDAGYDFEDRRARRWGAWQ